MLGRVNYLIKPLRLLSWVNGFDHIAIIKTREGRIWCACAFQMSFLFVVTVTCAKSHGSAPAVQCLRENIWILVANKCVDDFWTCYMTTDCSISTHTMVGRWPWILECAHTCYTFRSTVNLTQSSLTVQLPRQIGDREKPLVILRKQLLLISKDFLSCMSWSILEFLFRIKWRNLSLW